MLGQSRASILVGTGRWRLWLVILGVSSTLDLLPPTTAMNTEVATAVFSPPAATPVCLPPLDSASPAVTGCPLPRGTWHTDGNMSNRQQTKEISLKKVLGQREKRASPWGVNNAGEESLGELLVTVALTELAGCSLVIAADATYAHSGLLQRLLHLPNPRQVVVMEGAGELGGVAWRAGSQCRAALILVTGPASLLAFMDRDDHHWDYQARVVVLGETREQLHRLALSRKGAKTEHLLGVVQGRQEGEWILYTNKLYSGDAASLIYENKWRDGALARPDHPLFHDHKLDDLRGAPLKVVTFEFEPSVMYYRDEDGQIKFPFGIDIEVISALSRVLNFTVAFEEPPEGEFWGVETDNRSWTGMVGRLARNEADMGVANLFLTLGRLGAVDYSAPYDAEVSCFLVRNDPPTPRWLSLALPFQLELWGIFLGGLLLSALLLFCFASAGARCGGEDTRLQSFPRAALYAVALHFREPQQVVPRRLHSQVLISFLWLYTIIITVAYCSNLTAFLTISPRTQGMETIRQLHASGIEVSGLGSFFRGALASAVDPYLQGLAERFVPYKELSVVWPRVRQGHAAYLHNRQFLEFVMANQFTSPGVASMRIMKQCFAPYSIALALQRHSPLKRRVDRVVRWMLESGLVRRWFLESLRLSRKVQEKTTEETKVHESPGVGQMQQGAIPLSVDHMQGLFFIFLIGVLFSFVVFVLEYCHSEVTRRTVI